MRGPGQQPPLRLLAHARVGEPSTAVHFPRRAWCKDAAGNPVPIVAVEAEEKLAIEAMGKVELKARLGELGVDNLRGSVKVLKARVYEAMGYD